MNNDINNKINFIGSAKNNNNAVQKSQTQKKPEKYEPETIQNPLNFLGTLGCAQVNMDNLENKRLKNALNEFQSDPDKIEAHITICDELVKKGYPLEKAILTTDKIFDVLSNRETYI